MMMMSDDINLFYLLVHADEIMMSGEVAIIVLSHLIWVAIICDLAYTNSC